MYGVIRKFVHHFKQWFFAKKRIIFTNSKNPRNNEVYSKLLKYARTVSRFRKRRHCFCFITVSAVLQSNLITIKFGTAEARHRNWALVRTFTYFQAVVGLQKGHRTFSKDYENQLFKNNEEIIPDYKILPNARTSDTSGEHNIYKRPFLQLSAIRTNFTWIH